MTAETELFIHFFDRLHGRALEAIAGLPVEALNWRPLPGAEGDDVTNSLAATLAHLVGSERYWVGEVVGGRPANRDRPAEFRAVAEDEASLRQAVEATGALIRDVLSTVTEARLAETTHAMDREITRHWAMIHALDHASLHLGHMQLTRQLWEGRA
jgi:uncharacterized damage-inducible protein DinB